MAFSLHRFVFLSSALVVIGCSKRIPSDIAPVVEAKMPIVIQIAKDTAALCPAMKARTPFRPSPIDAPAPPPLPAAASALASDTHVVDVFVTCSWPAPPPSTGDTWAGTSFPRLKGTSAIPVRSVTMPDEIARNTCAKDPHECEQIIVPSRHHASPSSADIRVVRKTVDGIVEVVVALAP